MSTSAYRSPIDAAEAYYGQLENCPNYGKLLDEQANAKLLKDNPAAYLQKKRVAQPSTTSMRLKDRKRRSANYYHNLCIYISSSYCCSRNP